jgi:LmbE family N-acetylglucosaminyl deacetylase
VSVRITPAELGTVLGIWAHPDDEAYLMAGTALAAAAAGSTVACLTATAGGAGESADEDRWPTARLEEIRRGELAASLAILGITDHRYLNLADGGLADVDPADGVAMVSAAIERVRPDTILTFGPDGMTGHLDHITVGNWAVKAAASVAGDRCRILAATKTPAWIETFADVNEGILVGGEPPCTRVEDLALEVTLTGAALDTKVRALKAQASQTSGLSQALGDARYSAWVASEYWTEPS